LDCSSHAPLIKFTPQFIIHPYVIDYYQIPSISLPRSRRRLHAPQVGGRIAIHGSAAGRLDHLRQWAEEVDLEQLQAEPLQSK
jgi:hypothetical protein